MNTETLLYTLAQWNQAGARTLRIVVSNDEAGRLVYDLCCLDYDFVIEFQFAAGIKVFVIEMDGGNE